MTLRGDGVFGGGLSITITEMGRDNETGAGVGGLSFVQSNRFIDEFDDGAGETTTLRGGVSDSIVITSSGTT